MTRRLSAVPATRPTAEALAAALYEGQQIRHIDSLKPHPVNPRDEIDPADERILEMAGSIEKHGIIEPLIILPNGMVLCGHRRRVSTRVASERSNRPELMYAPIVVRNIPEDQVQEFMLQENMQRKSLNPLEEARTFKAIKDRKNFTVSDLARHLEIPASTISQRLPILVLRPEVQALYRDNELPLQAAPLLARVRTGAKQVAYAGLLARRKLTLDQFKKTVGKDLAPQPPDSPPTLGEPAFVPAASRLAAVPKNTRARGGGKKIKGGPEPGTPQAPTRAEAMSNLSKFPARRISLHTIRLVVDATCCSCGMMGNDEICRSCPLPKLLNGIVGRAEV